MSKVVLKVNNLSKRYRIGVINTGTLAHDLNRFYQRSFKGVDPYQEIGSSGQLSLKKDFFWPLRSLDFNVKQGEILGIIGKNGAGKSTLLKIISRITSPTEGSVEYFGRVGALLEVGTGFHPELTGRENIFLNGAILGMKKNEIKAVLDEIIDFSGVENYLDTPVKRYSSGMKVRLGFSVAAHLNTDILIIDEVLAVGDASFQKRCLQKISSLTSGVGKTVLFVSHNMGAISKLCSRALLLNEGRVQFLGDVEQAKELYLENSLSSIRSRSSDKLNLRNELHDFEICSVRYESDGLENVAQTGKPLVFTIKYKAGRKIKSPNFVVNIKDKYGAKLIQLNTFPISGYKIEEINGEGIAKLVIKKLMLTSGCYLVDIGLAQARTDWIIKSEDHMEIFVKEYDYYDSGFPLTDKRGVTVVDHEWYVGPND